MFHTVGAISESLPLTYIPYEQALLWPCTLAAYRGQGATVGKSGGSGNSQFMVMAVTNPTQLFSLPSSCHVPSIQGFPSH